MLPIAVVFLHGLLVDFGPMSFGRSSAFAGLVVGVVLLIGHDSSRSFPEERAAQEL
jgi:hypothetical protein